MRAKPLTALIALLFAPAAFAQSISGTEEIIWPESGAFIAYPAPPADGRVWRFSLLGAWHHNNNIFRLSDSANAQALLGSSDRSDSVRRLGAGVRADIPISRQVLSLEAEVNDNDFDRYDQLDYVGHRLNGLWRWRAGSRLAGDLGAGTRKVLGGFGDAQSGSRNLVTQNEAFVSAGYLLTPRWRMRGAFDVSDLQHSSAARAAAETRTASTLLGLDYVTPATSSLGGQVRYTNGETPNPQTLGAATINNDYKQVETSLVAHWAPTGKTTLDGRAGYTERNYEQLSGRDFKGFTASVNANWAPSAKTLLGIALWRDVRAFQSVLESGGSPSQQPIANLPAPAAAAGQPAAAPGFVSSRGGFAAPREVVINSRDSILDPSSTPTDSVSETVPTYVVATGISLGPVWAPTAKIAFQARLLHERLDYKGDPGYVLGLNPRREDKFSGFSLGAGYTPIRAVLLALNFQTGKRTSNTVGRDYSYDAVTLSGRFTF